MNKQTQKKDSDAKKIFATLIMIAVLMLGITSGTYAYFALSATDNANIISGTAATASLTLSVSKAQPTTQGPLVPQYSYNNSKNVLALAIAGTSGNKCTDANGNTICLIYNIVVTNGSTSAVTLSGKITPSLVGSGSVFKNLKWYTLAQGKSATAGTTYSYPSSLSAAFGNNAFNTAGTTGVEGFLHKTSTGLKATTLDASKTDLLASGESYYYVIIFWIEETGGNQNTTDKGTFKAQIDFSAINPTTKLIEGGITSTITGAA